MGFSEAIKFSVEITEALHYKHKILINTRASIFLNIILNKLILQKKFM